MEKNLPYVSVGIIDDNYNKRVLPFMGRIDDGSLFKWFITTIWRLASYAMLIGGLYFIISNLMGDDNYCDSTFVDGMTGGAKVGAAIGLVVGILISVVCAWFLYSLTKKRTDQLNDASYNGLLHYVSHELIPRSITLFGELFFTLVMYVSVLQLVAALDGHSAYAPLMDYMGMFQSIMIPGMDAINGLIPNKIFGDFDNMDVTLRIAGMGIAGSFVILMFYYILKEVYLYGLKIILALISFIPKFAIPLSMRQSGN